MRLLIAGLMLAASSATAIEIAVDRTSDIRTETVSQTAKFFALRPNTPSVWEVSGTGSGILKLTAKTAAPTSFNGFIPDPNGAVSGNAAWKFPAGMSWGGFDAPSGSWTVTVSQPR